MICSPEAIASWARDAALRRRYSDAVLAEIPRIIGNLDRNPFRPTYGCFDRQHWHYRTAAFASEMYQEAVFPLAWAFATRCPGNRWYQREPLRDWVIAALHYSARAAHADGSCDDYYPYERALGAAVFSLVAGVKAYQRLDLRDEEIVAGFQRRARWIAAHQESGRLTNHHALAALALLRVSQLDGDRALRAAADARVAQVLAWQHAEGWFAEYDGADPGYQTVTIGCLAEYRALTGRGDLTEPLARGVEFCRWFLHPDGSYGGEYGSRGTYHCYPHGFELLAAESSAAADLADASLDQVELGRQACFDDDRLFSHRLISLCAAHDAWSPQRAVRDEISEQCIRSFAGAGLFVSRRAEALTIISAARGGVFKHFVEGTLPVTDGGLVVELTDGRAGVSQQHWRTSRQWHAEMDELTYAWRVTVEGQLAECRWETATPVKQAALHLGMVSFGRWCRGLVRKLLQRRLITSRSTLPIHHSRTIELIGVGNAALQNALADKPPVAPRLRVTDTIKLLAAKVQVKRLAFGVDHQAVYTAASGVYQDSVLQPWTDLAEHIVALNCNRSVAIVREFPA